MLKETGIISEEELNKILPDEERRKKGPFAVVECVEEIPCDPCTAACPFGAIPPFDNVNEVPSVDFDKCNGCGICIALCPGVAIFVVDETYTADKALLKLPYEFVPLPGKGEMVGCLDRSGGEICKGIVVRVQKHPSKTNIIWLEIPLDFSQKVRNIKLK